MADFSDRDDDPIGDGAAQGAESIEGAADAAAAAADRIKIVFEDAGSSISDSLVRAAYNGELSFRRLAEAAAQTLASSGIEQLFDAVFTPRAETLFSALPFLGARADGGPVTPGGAFLVGERGPELFAPTRAGDITPVGGAVTVNITMAGGAAPEALARSHGQIATAVARAVARGQRNL